MDDPTMLTMLWPWALLLVAGYCIVQMMRDCRRGYYLMAIVGAICLAVILFVPIQPHAVKLDVPMGR